MVREMLEQQQRGEKNRPEDYSNVHNARPNLPYELPRERASPDGMQKCRRGGPVERQTLEHLA